MLGQLSIRKRIMVILAAVYVVSLTVAISAGWYILRQDTIRESLEKTDIFAAAMSASQEYLAAEIRPRVLARLPNSYFPEATVGILMLAETAKKVQNKHPEYIFRIASPNPLNQDNLTDAFEEAIVDAFDNGEFETWQGFAERGGKRYYAIASPISAGENCIWCHDTPERAHPDMVARYGTQAGYGYELGQVVGARFVYVPTAVAEMQALKKLAWFAGGFSLFFLLALVAVDRIIVYSVVRPIEQIVEVATEISRGRMDRDFDVKSNDEIKALADAFKRMKYSLAKAMDILRV
ncbi:MAG: DUF3365 domain-containing protein [Desulfuromonadales bacterium]|nr:DUF3365 domain-containing protein [Desulfuromonadales bacterium]